jgi:hypothetical protein
MIALYSSQSKRAARPSPLTSAPEVDRPEVARVERVQRLLAARVRRLDQADVLDRVALVDAVDEHDPGSPVRQACSTIRSQISPTVQKASVLALRVALLELRPLLRARVLDLVDRLRLRAQLVMKRFVTVTEML